MWQLAFIILCVIFVLLKYPNGFVLNGRASGVATASRIYTLLNFTPSSSIRTRNGPLHLLDYYYCYTYYAALALCLTSASMFMAIYQLSEIARVLVWCTAWVCLCVCVTLYRENYVCWARVEKNGRSHSRNNNNKTSQMIKYSDRNQVWKYITFLSTTIITGEFESFESGIHRI